MTPQKNSKDLFIQLVSFLGRLAVKVIILIAATLEGCTIGSSIGNYLTSPYAVRWESLDTLPEKTAKILAADVDFIYVQSVTEKIYYCQVEDRRQCEITDSSSVRTRSAGYTSYKDISPNPPGKVVEMTFASMSGEMIREAKFALTDDGQVWLWRYTPPMFSLWESVIGGLVGCVIGFILAMTFDSGNTELIRPESVWDGWRFVAFWASLVPLAEILLSELTNGLTSIWRGAPIDYGKLFIGEVLFGAGIAITQWLILRDWHYNFPGWIWVTTLGWSLGYVASIYAAQYFGKLFDPGFQLIFASPIVVAAIGQCLCLRQSLIRSGFWIAANAGAAIFSSTILQEYRDYMPANIDSYNMWVLIGLALALLLRKPCMKNLLTPTTN